MATLNKSYNLQGILGFDLVNVGNSCQNTSTPNAVFLQNSAYTPTFELTAVIVNVYIVTGLCIMGFIGNSLSIAVLYRDHDKKNTTNWLLQSLAVMDSMYLVTCIFIQTLQTINEFTNWLPTMKEALALMKPYTWPISSMAQTTTVWTVMLVTIDRYIAICMPLKTHLRSVNRAKVAVAVVCLLAVVYNIPMFFEKYVYINYGSSECSTRLIGIVKTALGKNNVYFLTYKLIMFLLFRTLGPLLILIVLNVQLIRALREMRRRHTDLTKGSKHRENITLMLVVVVTAFVLCELPDLCLRITLILAEYELVSVNSTSISYASLFTNMLLTVNSAINFLIYCLVGKKFRMILKEMSACGVGPGGAGRSQQRGGDSQMENSETEPLTTRTNILTKNGNTQTPRDGDVCL